MSRSDALDFFSPSFDPLRALAEPGLTAPIPSAAPLDNIAKCRALLPPAHPDSTMDVTYHRRSEASVARHLGFKERAVKAVDRLLGGVRQPLLAQLMDRCDGGPLEVLKKCVEDKTVITVHVGRAEGGVRGVARGVVTHFDSECNLILRHVEEEWGDRGGGGAATSSGAAPGVHRRQLKHVMLMGAQVAAVEAPVGPEGALRTVFAALWARGARYRSEPPPQGPQAAGADAAPASGR